MIKGIYISARGLDTRMKNLETVANNIANINTTGFKREVPFSEVMDKLGNTKIQQVTDYKQGDLVQTSNPLDLAVSGDGFFVVQTNNGEELTRSGSMQISEDGFLTNKNGNKVLGQNGVININNYLLDKNQVVTVSKDGWLKVGDKIVDKLLIAKPSDQQDIERTSGGNINPGGGYQIVDESKYNIKQGYIEESNVNPIKEMEAMIQLNSQYESSQKMINFLDQSLSEATQIGKV